MIIFIKIIICLGMLSFPLIYSVMGGSAKIDLVKGFVLGANFEQKVYEMKSEMEDGSVEESTHKVSLMYFYLGVFAVVMAWSKIIDDVR